MAIKFKKRFDYPVRCGQCKEKKAYGTVHGSIPTWMKGTCCKECFVDLKEEYEADQERYADKDETEAEYQISRRWGI